MTDPTPNPQHKDSDDDDDDNDNDDKGDAELIKRKFSGSEESFDNDDAKGGDDKPKDLSADSQTVTTLPPSPPPPPPPHFLPPPPKAGVLGLRKNNETLPAAKNSSGVRTETAPERNDKDNEKEEEEEEEECGGDVFSRTVFYGLNKSYSDRAVDLQIALNKSKFRPSMVDPVYRRQNLSPIAGGSPEIAFERIPHSASSNFFDECDSFFRCILHYEGQNKKVDDPSSANLTSIKHLRKTLVDALLFACFELSREEAECYLCTAITADDLRGKSASVGEEENGSADRTADHCELDIGAYFKATRGTLKSKFARASGDSPCPSAALKNPKRTPFSEAKKNVPSIASSLSSRSFEERGTGDRRSSATAVEEASVNFPVKKKEMEEDRRRWKLFRSPFDGLDLGFSLGNFLSTKIFLLLKESTFGKRPLRGSAKRGRKSKGAPDTLYGSEKHVVGALKYILDLYAPTKAADSDLLLTLYAVYRGVSATVYGFFDEKETGASLSSARGGRQEIFGKLRTYYPARYAEEEETGCYLYLAYHYRTFELLEPVLCGRGETKVYSLDQMMDFDSLSSLKAILSSGGDGRSFASKATSLAEMKKKRKGTRDGENRTARDRPRRAFAIATRFADLPFSPPFVEPGRSSPPSSSIATISVVPTASVAGVAAIEGEPEERTISETDPIEPSTGAFPTTERGEKTNAPLEIAGAGAVVVAKGVPSFHLVLCCRSDWCYVWGVLVEDLLYNKRGRDGRRSSEPPASIDGSSSFGGRNHLSSQREAGGIRSPLISGDVAVGAEGTTTTTSEGSLAPPPVEFFSAISSVVDWGKKAFSEQLGFASGNGGKAIPRRRPVIFSKISFSTGLHLESNLSRGTNYRGWGFRQTAPLASRERKEGKEGGREKKGGESIDRLARGPASDDFTTVSERHAALRSDLQKMLSAERSDDVGSYVREGIFKLSDTTYNSLVRSVDYVIAPLVQRGVGYLGRMKNRHVEYGVFADPTIQRYSNEGGGGGGENALVGLNKYRLLPSSQKDAFFEFSRNRSSLGLPAIFLGKNEIASGGEGKGYCEEKSTDETLATPVCDVPFELKPEEFESYAYKRYEPDDEPGPEVTLISHANGQRRTLPPESFFQVANRSLKCYLLQRVMRLFEFETYPAGTKFLSDKEINVFHGFDSKSASYAASLGKQSSRSGEDDDDYGDDEDETNDSPGTGKEKDRSTKSVEFYRARRTSNFSSDPDTKRALIDHMILGNTCVYAIPLGQLEIDHGLELSVGENDNSEDYEGDDDGDDDDGKDNDNNDDDDDDDDGRDEDRKAPANKGSVAEESDRIAPGMKNSTGKLRQRLISLAHAKFGSLPLISFSIKVPKDAIAVAVHYGDYNFRLNKELLLDPLRLTKNTDVYDRYSEKANFFSASSSMFVDPKTLLGDPSFKRELLTVVAKDERDIFHWQPRLPKNLHTALSSSPSPGQKRQPNVEAQAQEAALQRSTANATPEPSPTREFSGTYVGFKLHESAFPLVACLKGIPVERVSGGALASGDDDDDDKGKSSTAEGGGFGFMSGLFGGVDDYATSDAKKGKDKRGRRIGSGGGGGYGSGRQKLPAVGFEKNDVLYFVYTVLPPENHCRRRGRKDKKRSSADEGRNEKRGSASRLKNSAYVNRVEAAYHDFVKRNGSAAAVAGRRVGDKDDGKKGKT
jgi:hypothetical protein